MQPKHLHHKQGGTVTDVLGLGHRTIDGVAYWFYLCNVTWTDGKVSEGIEVMPDRLCTASDNADGMAEITGLSDKLSAHLRERGRWLKKPKWVGDRLVHWVPRAPEHVELFD